MSKNKLYNNQISTLNSWEEAYKLLESDFNLKLSQLDKENVLNFYTFLQEINKITNLTKLDSEKDFITYHLIDTALILSCLNLHSLREQKQIHYLDLGSGCGIPGLLLHLYLQNLSMKINTVLCEIRKKRAEFLEQAIEKLKLNNITVQCKKAENIIKDTYYNNKKVIITARAFAKPLNTLLIIKPLLLKQNLFIYQTSISLKTDLEYQNKLTPLRIELEKEFMLGNKKRVVGRIN